MAYHDKLFAKIYFWYISKKENDIPALYSILLISLFQMFNVLAFIFLFGGIFYGRNWSFSKIEIIILSFAILLFDYVRIYQVIKFKTLIARYSTPESRKMSLHPVLYFALSILLLVILRLVGFYPDIT